MSSIKIKELVEKTDNLNDEDLIIIEDIEDTKKITLLRLKSAFSMDGILSATKNMLLDKINSFIESHSAKYKELEEKNNRLEILCHNLQNDHDHDANRIFELEDQLVHQTDQISSLTWEKNRLSTQLEELQKSGDDLSDEIILLKAQNNLNESKITTLKSQVKDLQNKSKELKEVNEELQELVNTLETESNNKIDQSFNDANTKLSESIDDLMSYIRYYHPDVDDIFN